MDGEALSLTVEDNGRGIKEAEFESSKSLGFLGLRERVLAFGGSLDVKGDVGYDVAVPYLAKIAGAPETQQAVRALATRGLWFPRRRPETVTLVHLARA